MLTTVVIFVLTYVAISARRLGTFAIERPTGALLGAVACVVAGALTPTRALAAVDAGTLLLLFAMMGMGAFLGVDGFFARAGGHLGRWAQTPARLLGALVWGSGVLAALITNDAVCVLAAPLVVALVERHRLPPAPFLLALATGANTGSVATLVGNPQNMLCAQLGGLAYRDHLLLVGPIAVAALGLNHLILWLAYRRRLPRVLDDLGSVPKPLMTPHTRVTLAVLAASVVAYTAGADLPWTAAAGLALLLLVHRKNSDAVWARIDWSVLVFFAGLFVVVEAVRQSGASDWLFAHAPLWPQASAGEVTTAPDAPLAWWRLSALFLVGSNLVSNVPFILVVADQVRALPLPERGWELLAVASTFAGNLTLLGSVANVIVAEKGESVGGLRFFEHLRVGAPIALVTTVVGTAWIFWWS